MLRVHTQAPHLENGLLFLCWAKQYSAVVPGNVSIVCSRHTMSTYPNPFTVVRCYSEWIHWIHSLAAPSDARGFLPICVSGWAPEPAPKPTSVRCEALSSI